MSRLIRKRSHACGPLEVNVCRCAGICMCLQMCAMACAELQVPLRISSSMFAFRMCPRSLRAMSGKENKRPRNSCDRKCCRPDVAKLNVGGRTFWTTPATLAQCDYFRGRLGNAFGGNELDEDGCMCLGLLQTNGFCMRRSARCPNLGGLRLR